VVAAVTAGGAVRDGGGEVGLYRFDDVTGRVIAGRGAARFPGAAVVAPG
jgi:hypothetical protein